MESWARGGDAASDQVRAERRCGGGTGRVGRGGQAPAWRFGKRRGRHSPGLALWASGEAGRPRAWRCGQAAGQGQVARCAASVKATTDVAVACGWAGGRREAAAKRGAVAGGRQLRNAGRWQAGGSCETRGGGRWWAAAKRGAVAGGGRLRLVEWWSWPARRSGAGEAAGAGQGSGVLLAAGVAGRCRSDGFGPSGAGVASSLWQCSASLVGRAGVRRSPPGGRRCSPGLGRCGRGWS
jgi:hypothetical protein